MSLPSGSSPVAPGSGPYLQAALFGIARPAGVASRLVGPPISGSALGGAVGFGSFLSRAVAIEGEFAVRGTVATPQHFAPITYLLEYTAEVQDLSFGALVRWRPGGGRYVELTGGYGLAFTTVTHRDPVRIDAIDLPPFTGIERLATVKKTSYEPFLTGGIATPIPVGRRMAIVPTFALRWIQWPDDGRERFSGVGGLVYQFGVGARFGL